jgi:myo-inositol-1-phosphate synthase
LDRGISGTLLGPSSYFMKSPSEQYPDSEARQKTEDFIKGLF